MVEFTLEHVFAAQDVLGEGPLWDPDAKLLYWVDLEGRRVHRLNPQSMAHQLTQFEHKVSCLGLRQMGGFVVGTSAGIGFWDGHSAHLDLRLHPEADKPQSRFNDGAVGPRGRFWAGTLSESGTPSASLYRYDPDGSLRVAVPEMLLSNGLGWSPDQRYFYLTDTERKLIWRFAFDPASGELSQRQDFVNSQDEDGYPDGLTVDSEGCIWSARFAGGRVTRYDPEGRKMQDFRLPVDYVTSCSFGGADLQTLYITTSHRDVKDRQQQPQAGDLFALHTDITGQRPYRFAG